MTPAGGGRHCASCNKVLPDFSQKTNEEILEYMANASGEVCGRFRADQVTDGTTYGGWKFYSKWKVAVSVLLIGSVFMISCRQKIQGKRHVPFKEEKRHTEPVKIPK